MTRPRHLPLWILCYFLLVGSCLSAQTLQVIDPEGHATTLTAPQISNLPHVIVKVIDHDTPAQFEGVSLAGVLSAAGVQLGDKLRGSRMTEVLVAEASDGYKAVFALAEVDPAFAVREIILADKRDGKPLDAKEGPPKNRRAGR
jgi:hypothetical protein